MSSPKPPRSHADAPLVNLAYIVTLCVTPKQFYAFLRKAKIPANDHPTFLEGDDNDAVVHFIRGADKKRHAVVCVSDQHGEPFPKVLSLLVHEAVHIWQWHREFMGEDSPSREFEAYSIQAISQLLMEAYVENSSAV